VRFEIHETESHGPSPETNSLERFPARKYQDLALRDPQEVRRFLGEHEAHT